MLSIDTSPDQLDLVFTALGNAKRREIVRTLSLRPATIGQLAERHGMSLPSIHRHIGTLEEAGLLQRRKVGRTNFVAIKRPALASAQAWIMQYRTDWGNDEESLTNYITMFQNYNAERRKEP